MNRLRSILATLFAILFLVNISSAEVNVFDGQVGDVVNILVNDFGTQEQRDAWEMIGDVTYLEDPTLDRDGDGLGAQVNYVWDQINEHKLKIRVDAPEGFSFARPVAKAQGFGSRNNWCSYTYLQLSADGENWEVYSGFPREVNGWYSLESDSQDNQNFQNLKTVYLMVTMAGYVYTPDYLPRFKDLTFTAELVGELADPNPERAVYVNDFGTTAQRTVGADGDWDSVEILNGTPDIVYYPNGWNGLAKDWDGDSAKGGMSANGNMGVRWIKHITLDEGQVMRNLRLSAGGHASSSVESSFAVGLSRDGVVWDYVDSTSAEWNEYSSVTADPNDPNDPSYNLINDVYIMVEWQNNQNTVDDPELSAYISGVYLEADVLNSTILDSSQVGLYGANSQFDFDFGTTRLDFTDNKLLTADDRQEFWDDIHKTNKEANRLKFIHINFDEDDTITVMKEKLDRLFGMDEGVCTWTYDLLGIYFKEERLPNEGITDQIQNELYDYIKANWPEIDVYTWYSYPILPLSFASGVAEKCDGYIFDDYYSRDRDVFRRIVMKHLVTGKKFVSMIWASEPNWSNDGFFIEDWIDGVAQEDQNKMVTDAPNSTLEKYFHMTTGVLREFGLPVSMFGVVGDGNPYQWATGNKSPNHEYIINELVEPLKLEMRLSDGKPAASSEFAYSDGVEVLTQNGNTCFDYGENKDVVAGPYIDTFKSDNSYVGLRTIDHASIRGFSKLRQSSDINGTLFTCSEVDEAGRVELVYRFYAESGSLGSVSVSLTGSVLAENGGVNTVGLSKDGLDVSKYVTSTPGVSSTETLTVDGGAEYENLSAFYVHVVMDFDNSTIDSPANVIDELSVSAAHNPSGVGVPEPVKCGDNGYLKADIAGGKYGDVHDCYVDMADFAKMASQWMECTDPANPAECK